ncbi:hypothetical protein TNCV_338261 [Trichonephila clavipes]|nr:hypothetical protein TNCV_338261 [Trichonephila clavipes]
MSSKGTKDLRHRSTLLAWHETERKVIVILYFRCLPINGAHGLILSRVSEARRLSSPEGKQPLRIFRSGDKHLAFGNRDRRRSLVHQAAPRAIGQCSSSLLYIHIADNMSPGVLLKCSPVQPAWGCQKRRSMLCASDERPSSRQFLNYRSACHDVFLDHIDDARRMISQKPSSYILNTGFRQSLPPLMRSPSGLQ